MSRDILVTSALPYANGPLHLGHLLETIQTDIWVRFQRAAGNRCIYVCADDAHGTAIMLTAEREGITPEQQIAKVQAEHERDFSGFLIGFDNYYSTHSDECREFSEDIYGKLRQGGHIEEREITQLFDPEQGLFLADRYVKGDCPRCKTPDQYGDNCESCGATYNASELGSPRSVLSGATPVEKASTHVFFRLADFEQDLKTWTRNGSLQPQIANKLGEWLEAGLQSWDISRDAPYFGFRIPGTDNQYFYVWLDAPVGYMASFADWAKRQQGEVANMDHWWSADSTAELYHFIGKDIINFHGLFWPAMLQAAGMRKPSGVFAHGFVTVNGTKMSKSRGTFVKASTYLQHLDPEYLRYYYASKLNASVEDIDLNMEDFVQRANTDLVGKLVNIASRSAKFVSKGNDGKLTALLCQDSWQQLQDSAADITEAYENREFSKAMRLILAQADATNTFFDAKEPWKLAKQEGGALAAAEVASQCLNHFRQLMAWLQPVLPQLSQAAAKFLNSNLPWQCEPLRDHAIDNYKPLLTRIDPKAVDAMMLQSAGEAASSKAKPAPVKAEATDFISIDDFNKVSLKVARIEKAETVDGADRLLRLTLDLGDHQRQVLSGIRAAYEPAALEGRLTVVVANLQPRTMKFGTSEGMVLCAGPGGDKLWLLAPDSGAEPGMDIR